VGLRAFAARAADDHDHHDDHHDERGLDHDHDHDELWDDASGDDASGDGRRLAAASHDIPERISKTGAERQHGRGSASLHALLVGVVAVSTERAGAHAASAQGGRSSAAARQRTASCRSDDDHDHNDHELLDRRPGDDGQLATSGRLQRDAGTQRRLGRPFLSGLQDRGGGRAGSPASTDTARGCAAGDHSHDDERPAPGSAADGLQLTASEGPRDGGEVRPRSLHRGCHRRIGGRCHDVHLETFERRPLDAIEGQLHEPVGRRLHERHP
jgi:hypothetical protein